MENSMEVPSKTKNRITIWPSNPTTGHIPSENHNSKRHMHPSVHCSTMFWPFLNQVVCFLILNCVSCLYISYINPLSIISFANIFSHSVGCHFILSMVSFAVQKLLSLIMSPLFISAFVPFPLGDRSKKTIATIYVKECSAFVLF